MLLLGVCLPCYLLALPAFSHSAMDADECGGSRFAQIHDGGWDAEMALGPAPFPPTQSTVPCHHPMRHLLIHAPTRAELPVPCRRGHSMQEGFRQLQRRVRGWRFQACIGSCATYASIAQPVPQEAHLTLPVAGSSKLEQTATATPSVCPTAASPACSARVSGCGSPGKACATEQGWWRPSPGLGRLHYPGINNPSPLHRWHAHAVQSSSAGGAAPMPSASTVLAPPRPRGLAVTKPRWALPSP